jgi:hypothetical protein
LIGLPKRPGTRESNITVSSTAHKPSSAHDPDEASARRAPGLASIEVMMHYERRVEPLSTEWRSFQWTGGAFDTVRRAYTETVEGIICMPQHLILVTLNGGAKYQEVEASCGHRFIGGDHPGTVSFVPAQCRRHLKFKGVASEWASMSIDPGVLEQDEPSATRLLDQSTFTNVSDELLRAAVLELARLSNIDGGVRAALLRSDVEIAGKLSASPLRA